MNFKEKKIIADRICQWYDEYVDKYFNDVSRYGHLQYRHINVSDTVLMRRITREGLYFCSTFSGLSESKIVELCRWALHEFKEEVALYMGDREDDDDYKLYVNTDTVIGKSYLKNPQIHNWDDGAILCTDFVIAIKHRCEDNGFYITTVYPICSEFDNW